MSAADHGLGRLQPPVVEGGTLPAGVHEVDLGGPRPALLAVPADRQGPAPLLVFCHGAGGDAHQSLDLVGAEAALRGICVLAPSSHAQTWDLLAGGLDHDVAAIEAGVGVARARVPLDRERLAIGGFSDGASYALSLGLANGDLFSSILAFSPGFAAPPSERGHPAIFVSHGTDDRVLPIGVTSRRVVPRLRQAGYDVEYHEFDGGHGVPPAAVEAALALLSERPQA